MLDKIKKSLQARGFALAYVLFMVAILFLLGYTLVMTMRNEASSAFTHLDASIAHFVAETGVEHALYVVRDHKYSDYIQTLSAESSLDINKKFGAFASFADYVIPKDNPNDSWVTSAELKSANIETKIKEYIPEAKINFIKLKFDLQKKVDDNLAFGIMNISCQGEYRNARRTVTVQKQVELYRDISVMYQYAFAVNEDKTEQVMKGRRKNDGLISASGAKGATWASNFIPQYFIVNNTVSWNTPEEKKVPAKVFGRKLVVELNESREEALISKALLPPIFQGIMGALAQLSLMVKFHCEEVDPKIQSHIDSPMAKYVQHTGSAYMPLGAASAEVYVNKGLWRLCEHDFPTGGWEAVKETLGGLVAATGGSRGNIDLTGHFPPIGWVNKATDYLGTGFNSLIGATNEEKTEHNIIYGDVKRRYGVMESGWLSSFSKVELKDEEYDFTDKVSNVVPGDIIGNNGQLTYLYDDKTYRKIAERHNIIAANVDFAGNSSLKGEKIPHLFDATTNEKFFETRKYKGDVAFFSKEKEYKKVVWRPFWGWGDSSDQCVKELPWYNFSTSKNVFEAAGQSSKYAIAVDGVYFVDGDVLIEGFYKGRGAIVATGNIIVGGEILRHPDDATFDDGCEKNYELFRGSNNCLQLIALGTKDASASEFGVTGKIIFSPHPYDAICYSGVFKDFQSYFSSKPYVRIDAYLYGKNGMCMDLASRKDVGFKVFGGSDDTFITIHGNYTCQELNWKDDSDKDSYPDKLMINPFQAWIEKIDENFKKKYCTINYNVSRSDNYTQQRE